MADRVNIYTYAGPPWSRRVWGPGVVGGLGNVFFPHLSLGDVREGDDQNGGTVFRSQ